MYLGAGALFLLMSVGLVDKVGGNGITGAAIGGGGSLSFMFVMIASIVMFGLFFMKKQSESS